MSKPSHTQMAQAAAKIRQMMSDEEYFAASARPTKNRKARARARDPLGPSDSLASGSAIGTQRTRTLRFDFTKAQVEARDDAALTVMRRIQPVRYRNARVRDLPVTMQHKLLNAERKAFQTSVGRKMRKRLVKGWRVYQLTVTNPRWNKELTDLDLKSLARPKEWIRRRAEGLAKHGKFILGGFVDLSFVDRGKLGKPSFWSPHVHVLIAIKAPKNYDVRCVIQDAFYCRTDNASGVKVTVKLDDLITIDDIIRTERYITSKLYPECRQLRVPLAKYSRGTASRPDRRCLRQVEQDVFYPLLEDWDPSGRWILAGLIRRNGEVHRHPPSTKIRREKRYFLEDKAQNGPVRALNGYDSYLDE